MIIYEVFYGQVLIGTLTVDSNGQHRYVINEETASDLGERLFVDLRKSRGFGPPIPFFFNRMTNAARFGEMEEIGYETDSYILRRTS